MELRRRTNICLNMIVKNEAGVLDRLFRSVRDYIDYYVIADTGSTDGTPELIERWMGEAGIPGEVHRHDWVNFGVNRNQALQLAYAADKADWVLFIDADEELACSNPRFYEHLEPGVTYLIEKHHDSIRYAVPHLADIRHTQWEWRGPVHEYLNLVRGTGRRSPRSDVWVIYHSGEGARSQGVSQRQKFLRDARLLEKELKKNPEDHRSRFYLAQSYRDAGLAQRAYEEYKRRAGMIGGWDEETFTAQLEAGRLSKALKRPHGTILAELLAAYDLRPTRGEPLHELAVHCREERLHGQAYLFAKMGLTIPYPRDVLFVTNEVYEWKLLDELAVAAYWVGRYFESREAGEELLRRQQRQVVRIPERDIERIRANLAFAIEKTSG